jgi:hypothetical protein
MEVVLDDGDITPGIADIGFKFLDVVVDVLETRPKDTRVNPNLMEIRFDFLDVFIEDFGRRSSHETLQINSKLAALPTLQRLSEINEVVTSSIDWLGVRGSTERNGGG